MPKFQVCITRMVEETAKIEIEAADADEAKEKAKGIDFNDDKIQWEAGDTINDERAYALLDGDGAFLEDL